MWLFINLPWVGISNRYSLEKLRLGFATLDGRLSMTPLCLVISAVGHLMRLSAFAAYILCE